MALFRKFISAVKKLFRGRPSRKKGKKSVRRSLRKKRPASRPRRKPARIAKRSQNKPTGKKKIFRPKKPGKSKPVPAKKLLPKKVLPPVVKGKPVKESQGVLIGEVTHYFSKIMVCVVKVTRGSLSVGNQIRVKGASGGGFVQKVVSLQIESQDVKVAPKGELVGLKVLQTVKAGDKVFKL